MYRTRVKEQNTIDSLVSSFSSVILFSVQAYHTNKTLPKTRTSVADLTLQILWIVQSTIYTKICHWMPVTEIWMCTKKKKKSMNLIKTQQNKKNSPFPFPPSINQFYKPKTQPVWILTHTHKKTAQTFPRSWLNEIPADTHRFEDILPISILLKHALLQEVDAQLKAEVLLLQLCDLLQQTTSSFNPPIKVTQQVAATASTPLQIWFLAICCQDQSR